MEPHKFISLTWYLGKLRLGAARFLLWVGIPLKVTTAIDEFQIKFVTTSALEYSLRARKSYSRERITMDWLRNTVDSGDVVYDVGANVGAYSLYAGKKLITSSGRVYAFEPAFFNFSALCTNIEVNSLNKAVLPFPIAFGDEPRPDSLFLSSTISGSALHAVGRQESDGEQFTPRFVQGIFSITIDEFSSFEDVMFPNHIKIDVDGTEGAILRGMLLTMSDPRLKSIMIEVNGNRENNSVEELLHSNGFELVDEEQWQGKESYNKLFLRRGGFGS